MSVLEKLHLLLAITPIDNKSFPAMAYQSMVSGNCYLSLSSERKIIIRRFNNNEGCLVLVIEGDHLPFALWETREDLVLFFEQTVSVVPKYGGNRVNYRTQGHLILNNQAAFFSHLNEYEETSYILLQREKGPLRMSIQISGIQRSWEECDRPATGPLTKPISRGFMRSTCSPYYLFYLSGDQLVVVDDPFEGGEAFGTIHLRECTVTSCLGYQYIPRGEGLGIKSYQETKELGEVHQRDVRTYCFYKNGRVAISPLRLFEPSEWFEAIRPETRNLFLCRNKLYWNGQRVVPPEQMVLDESIGSLKKIKTSVYNYSYEYQDDPFDNCKLMFTFSDSLGFLRGIPHPVRVRTAVSDTGKIVAVGNGTRIDLFERALRVFQEKWLEPCGEGSKFRIGALESLGISPNGELITLEGILASNLVDGSYGACPFHLPPELLACIMGRPDLGLSELAYLVRKRQPDICQRVLGEINNHVDYGYDSPEAYLEHFVGWSNSPGGQLSTLAFPLLRDLFRGHSIVTVDHLLSGSYHISIHDLVINLESENGLLPFPAVSEKLFDRFVSLLESLDQQGLRSFLRNITGSSRFTSEPLLVRILGSKTAGIRFDSCLKKLTMDRRIYLCMSDARLLEVLTDNSWSSMTDPE